MIFDFEQVNIIFSIMIKYNNIFYLKKNTIIIIKP